MARKKNYVLQEFSAFQHYLLTKRQMKVNKKKELI